ncbi:LOW QUALITY PROTEIN: C9orf47 isoform 3 [Pan troglodytes]|uniref:C9orf47 isoform 3 n=1 Tax=Pan troglodytes TaxID=9598 RepID=A0A2J8KTJ0_PANTR|nr:LOW QUALITY PROTEIN: C9orf47 isoform 3 [Pan troglodytes]
MVRIWTTIMIVLILLRIGPNKPSLSGRQAPAQAQTSDLVPSLFPLGLWAPGFCTWSSPDEDRRPRKPVPGTGNRDSGTRRRLQDATEQDPRPGNDVASAETAGPPSPAGIRAQDRAPRHRRAPPARMPVAPAPSADGGERRARAGRGTRVGGWGPKDPPFQQNPHRSRARRGPGRATAAGVHISTPPPEPLQERGGGLFHRTGSVYNGLELNTWMKVERLFVEKFHQSFSLDN